MSLFIGDWELRGQWTYSNIVGVVYKVDLEEINQESTSTAIAFVDDENSNRGDTTLEMAIGRFGPLPNTIVLLSTPLNYVCTTPYDGGCLMPRSQFPSLYSAANNDMYFKDDTVDYRGHRVMTSQDRIDALGLGFVYEMEYAEITKPLVQEVLILMGSALGVSIVGVLIIGWAGRTMLKSIEDTWERGKQAVEQEKASFETLVGALYPKFVSEKLLAGEHQIVMELQTVLCGALNLSLHMLRENVLSRSLFCGLYAVVYYIQFLGYWSWKYRFFPTKSYHKPL